MSSRARRSRGAIEAASDPEAVDEFGGWSVEHEAAVTELEADAREKRDEQQVGRDRREKIEDKIARREKVLKDTKTGKQGRHE